MQQKRYIPEDQLRKLIKIKLSEHYKHRLLLKEQDEDDVSFLGDNNNQSKSNQKTLDKINFPTIKLTELQNTISEKLNGALTNVTDFSEIQAQWDKNSDTQITKKNFEEQLQIIGKCHTFEEEKKFKGLKLRIYDFESHTAGDFAEQGKNGRFIPIEDEGITYKDAIDSIKNNVAAQALKDSQMVDIPFYDIKNEIFYFKLSEDMNKELCDKLSDEVLDSVKSMFGDEDWIDYLEGDISNYRALGGDLEEGESKLLHIAKKTVIGAILGLIPIHILSGIIGKFINWACPKLAPFLSRFVKDPIVRFTAACTEFGKKIFTKIISLNAAGFKFLINWIWKKFGAKAPFQVAESAETAQVIKQITSKVETNHARLLSHEGAEQQAAQQTAQQTTAQSAQTSSTKALGHEPSATETLKGVKSTPSQAAKKTEESSAQQTAQQATTQSEKTAGNVTGQAEKQAEKVHARIWDEEAEQAEKLFADKINFYGQEVEAIQNHAARKARYLDTLKRLRGVGKNVYTEDSLKTLSSEQLISKIKNLRNINLKNFVDDHTIETSGVINISNTLKFDFYNLLKDVGVAKMPLKDGTLTPIYDDLIHLAESDPSVKTKISQFLAKWSKYTHLVESKQKKQNLLREYVREKILLNEIAPAVNALVGAAFGFVEGIGGVIDADPVWPQQDHWYAIKISRDELPEQLQKYITSYGVILKLKANKGKITDPNEIERLIVSVAEKSGLSTDLCRQIWDGLGEVEGQDQKEQEKPADVETVESKPVDAEESTEEVKEIENTNVTLKTFIVPPLGGGYKQLAKILMSVDLLKSNKAKGLCFKDASDDELDKIAKTFATIFNNSESVGGQMLNSSFKGKMLIAKEEIDLSEITLDSSKLPDDLASKLKGKRITLDQMNQLRIKKLQQGSQNQEIDAKTQEKIKKALKDKGYDIPGNAVIDQKKIDALKKKGILNPS